MEPIQDWADRSRIREKGTSGGWLDGLYAAIALLVMLGLAHKLVAL